MPSTTIRDTSSLARVFCGVLIGFSVVILGAYWVSRIATERELEEGALRELEQRATALTEAVGEQTRGAIFNLDLALIHLAHRYATEGALSELDIEEIKMSTPPGLVRCVTVADSAGRVTATYPGGGAGVETGDRPHFAAHVDPKGRSAGSGLYIGAPVRSRIDDEWVIPLSRRLTDGRGRFAGVIAIMARPEYFAAIYARLTAGRSDVVALVRRDGSFLARSHNLEEHLGKAVRPDRPFVGESAPEAGTFRSLSSYEPIDRVFAFRRLDEWPLVAVIGLGVEAPMTALRRERQRDLQAAIAVSGLVVVLVIGICIVIMRLDASLGLVRESDRRRALAFAGASELAWEWDVAARRVHFFGDCRPYFGIDADERTVALDDWLPQIHPDDREAVREQTRRYLAGGAGSSFETRYRLRFAGGDYRWVLVRGQTTVADAGGGVARALGILMDVDASRRAEIEAAQTREAYRRLIESAGEGIFVVDRQGRVQLFNPAAERVLGWRADEVIGRPAHTLFHCSAEGVELISADECPLMLTLADGVVRRGVRLSYRHRDGHSVPVEISVSPITLDGVADGAVAVISDVSKQIAHEAELQRLARTDGLTGLDNRRCFVELFERELRRAEREDAPLSLLMIDIDHFKQVNDRHGHAAGDAVLVALAEHFRAQLRQVDLIGRLGGEEFGVGLPGIALDEAAGVAERLRKTLAALEIPVGEQRLRCTVSVGVAIWQRPESFDAVLARADAALYEAKNGGRDRVVVRPAPARASRAPALPGSAG